MSESSLPPFEPARRFRALPKLAGALARSPIAALERLRALARGRRRRARRPVEAPDPLKARAERLVREYLDAHAENLERAARLEEKAGRLERAGTPSESARNRAARARGEVVAGLAAVRARFVEAVGREGARAFDLVVELVCPAYVPPGAPDARA